MTTPEPSPSGPLLTIGIPTYNRADFLDLCLATVLPQVREHLGEVECVISDNASDDETPEVIARYTNEFPLRHFRNDRNLGPIGNLLVIANQHANGRYLWFLGDDDTLNAGAVSQVLRFLHRHAPCPDLVALNVGYVSGTERPAPDAALGGVSPEPRQTLRDPTLPDRTSRFEELFTGPCADFTAIYSFILRRSNWTRFFGGWKPDTDGLYESLEQTYPHACVVAGTMPGKEAGLISRPLVTLYELDETEFSWSRHVPLVTLVRTSELLQRFRYNGIDQNLLDPYIEHQVKRARRHLHKLLWNGDYAGDWRDVVRLFVFCPGHRRALLSVLREVCVQPNAPAPARKFFEALSRIKIRFSRPLASRLSPLASRREET